LIECRGGPDHLFLACNLFASARSNWRPPHRPLTVTSNNRCLNIDTDLGGLDCGHAAIWHIKHDSVRFSVLPRRTGTMPQTPTEMANVINFLAILMGNLRDQLARARGLRVTALVIAAKRISAQPAEAGKGQRQRKHAMLSETRHCDCVIAFSCCMVGSICVADSPASPASHAAKWSARAPTCHLACEISPPAAVYW